MNNLNSTGKLISALIVGALAGATLGILFAPKKGSKLRKNIVESKKSSAKHFRKKMKKEAAALRKKAEQLEDLAQEKVENLTDEVMNKAEEVLKQK